MTDQNDQQDAQLEFLWLTRAARAQLEFYRDMGLTHIGGGIAAQPEEDEDMAKKKSTKAPVKEQASLFEVDEPSPAKKPIKTRATRNEDLADIKAETGHCCDLCPNATQVVFGEGNPKAELMFIGEAPGADEDATGRPFVGAAGRLLDKIIEAIGLKREDVYISNIVKCRPPGNRKPTTEEIESCEPFLFREIDVISPKVIVTLGATPLFSLLRVKEGITKARGHFYEYQGIPVMPTFHPAFLLRVPERKREVWQDMKKVLAKLEEVKE